MVRNDRLDIENNRKLKIISILAAPFFPSVFFWKGNRGKMNSIRLVYNGFISNSSKMRYKMKGTPETKRNKSHSRPFWLRLFGALFCMRFEFFFSKLLYQFNLLVLKFKIEISNFVNYRILSILRITFWTQEKTFLRTKRRLFSVGTEIMIFI